MPDVTSGVKTMVARLWRASAPLTAVGLMMIVALVFSVAGLWLDGRVITGVPAWLKPAKFALSIAIYCLTLAWIFTYLPEWPRTRRIVGSVTAAVFVLELAIIDTQAWRGTTSHFNVGTPLDATLFTVMGLAIVVQTLASIAVAVGLWRHSFTDRALGWALRLGMAITIIGGLSGGLMTRPTAAQLAEARATHRVSIAGAHTIGAPDGGPGILGTGWSAQHGDLRVPHFLGLHGVQALVLFLFVFGRRAAESRRTPLTIVAGTSYASLFGILIWQALRGQAVVAPDAATIGVLVGWAAATTAATAWALGRRSFAINPQLMAS